MIMNFKRVRIFNCRLKFSGKFSLVAKVVEIRSSVQISAEPIVINISDESGAIFNQTLKQYSSKLLQIQEVLVREGFSQG